MPEGTFVLFIDRQPANKRNDLLFDPMDAKNLIQTFLKNHNTMKTIQTSALSLMFALLTSATLLAQPEASAKVDHASLASVKSLTAKPSLLPRPVISPKNKTFGIGLYRVQESMTMRLTMEKKAGEKVVVRLLNTNGQVLHQEVVSRSAKKYACNFSFAEIQDGRYTIEVANGSEIQRKAINVSTNKTVEVPARTLLAMQ